MAEKSLAVAAQATKQFFGINPDRISAAGKDQIGSKEGDSLDAAGLSIREIGEENGLLCAAALG